MRIQVFHLMPGKLSTHEAEGALLKGNTLTSSIFAAKLYLKAPAPRFRDYSVIQAEVHKAHDDSRDQSN